ncbi:DNA polymerase III subunit gamma/tau [Vibrio sp. JPW-9-11-11]|uniref:DNA polymerase III subunit gamma/tau n=1 Tax=Vibrio sp. JPW-9-11-11 TaxID=1416532 RepID=UPI0015930707|nr:DNA polymerase III subunit gamma/tau [Vibrio sp. JPW-9-11-11]NVD06212.1 DNA polymerase III subunit gamma/tau [Vibrio sp. JPW-9-11-11]
MSYLALARKWRPTKFDEVVGQSHVLTALENALAQNRLHHAYLFSGTRGVGKTTIGRLFAKGLNCETGITATPCGVCDTCQEIDQGRFVDLLEIDAASRTKVEDTRELLDNVQYKPARGRFKVYLIDEVHMLSRHSFNALLKTLEEPPEYVKFLLATTDPQKLPVTILSRCLQFHLKPISVDTIHEQLDHILAKEQVDSETRALGMIAHAADGSMRDALSLTDQAIALGNGHVLADSVTHMLGTLDTDQALHLLESISSKQPQTAMASIAALANNGVEWDGLLQQLASQLHRIAMYQALPATLDTAQPDAEKIELLSRALSPQDVQLYYQIALKGRQDLPLAPSERVGLEMVVLRMLAFRPEQPQANLISTHPKAQPTSAPAAENAVQKTPQPESTEMPQQPSYNRPDDMPEPPPYEGPEYQSAPPSESYPSSPMAQPEPTPQASDVRVSSSLGGLRHQLRSQRKGLNPTQGNSPKKASAAPAKNESVLERVAQKHPGSAQVSSLSPVSQTAAAPEKDEPYQWKPTQPVVEKPISQLTPSILKKALEHEKTPEMAQKLIDESLKLDEWAQLISQLNTAKLTEQLALNSSFQRNGNTIALTLRPSQAHLNTDKAQSELLQELNRVLEDECYLSVEVGEAGETPLELRDRLYQGRLEQAFTSLESDPHVQFIERRFAAQLDKESIRPI